jgi:hypothetical protein
MNDDLTIKSWPMGATSPTTKWTVEGSIVGANIAPPKFIFTSQSSGPVMTIHPDGRITLGDDAKPTEAAVECVNAMASMIQNLIDNAAQTERARIIDMVKKRIATANDFIDACKDDEVALVFGGVMEMRSFLRELQQ